MREHKSMGIYYSTQEEKPSINRVTVALPHYRSWPELVGLDIVTAKTVIESERSQIPSGEGAPFRVRVISPSTNQRIHELFMSNRVIVHVDEAGKVLKVPKNG